MKPSWGRKFCIVGSGSSDLACGPAILASPGSPSELQSLRLQSRPAESICSWTGSTDEWYTQKTLRPPWSRLKSVVRTLRWASESPEGTGRDSGPPFPTSTSRGLWVLPWPSRWFWYTPWAEGLNTRYLQQVRADSSVWDRSFANLKWCNLWAYLSSVSPPEWTHQEGWNFVLFIPAFSELGTKLPFKKYWLNKGLKESDENT